MDVYRILIIVLVVLAIIWMLKELGVGGLMARDGLTKLEINDAGLRDLLTSDGVQRDLMRRGQAIAAAAGEGHQVDLNIESKRASVIVVTTSFRAMQNEATHRGLTRAIDAGR